MRRTGNSMAIANTGPHWSTLAWMLARKRADSAVIARTWVLLELNPHQRTTAKRDP